TAFVAGSKDDMEAARRKLPCCFQPDTAVGAGDEHDPLRVAHGLYPLARTSSFLTRIVRRQYILGPGVRPPMKPKLYRSNWTSARNSTLCSSRSSATVATRF